MRRVLTASLVLLLVATFASADVISDYNVKVVNATPSYPSRLGDYRYITSVGLSGFGTGGGDFQYWVENRGTGLKATAVNTYTDATMAVSWGSESTMQLTAAGGNFTPGSHPQSYDDYGAGAQVCRLYTWNYDCFYAVADDSSGITFSTPIWVTIVNVPEYHKHPFSTDGGIAHGITHLLDGGYLGYCHDNMAGASSTMTCLESLPAALWQNIDLPETTRGAWGQYDGASYLTPDGRVMRLCDNNLADIISDENDDGCGMWIQTVADTTGDQNGTHIMNGWRNDPDNVHTAAPGLENMLIGKGTFSQISGDNTIAYFKEQDNIALQAREKDTSAQWLLVYDARWPSRGIGYAKVMITAQKGDLNYDGKCDFVDLPLFSGAFGTSEGEANYNPDADMDGNNKVDFTDLPVFSGKFGQQCSQ